jgi:hypothetical protein
MNFLEKLSNIHPLLRWFGGYLLAAIIWISASSMLTGHIYNFDAMNGIDYKVFFAYVLVMGTWVNIVFWLFKNKKQCQKK